MAGREHSRQELQQKLLAKGYEQADVAAALDHCVELDLQSDQRFAESYLQSYIGRGHGPLKISHALGQKGVSDSVVAAAFAEYDSEYWLSHCRKVWQKKFSRPPETQAERAKQFRFLQQRGFSGEVIHRVISGEE